MRIGVIVVLLVTGFSNAVGQDAAPAYVSQMRVAVRGSEVRLTWTDPPRFPSGRLVVYRHNREITDQTLSSATIVTTVDRE